MIDTSDSASVRETALGQRSAPNRQDGGVSTPGRMDPAEQWRTELAAWAIPEHILAAAPQSPYELPVGLFTAEDEPADTPSRAAALEALTNGGSVLDVGCGGGRAGLALVPPAGSVIGVDSSPAMLAAFARAASARGVRHTEVAGSWPAAADRAGTADVVLAHHVVYNVPDLPTFADALTAAARHRVVLELTDAHPWVPTNALWQRLHGLERPSGPTATLAAQVLRGLGLDVQQESWQRPASPVERKDVVRLVRRRLCLPASADPAVDEALPADYAVAACGVTTLWWDVAAPS